MLRNALFASAVARGLAGAAQAQAPDTNGRPAPSTGNTMGGGGASIIGGGNDMLILYSPGGAGVGAALHAQPPRLARARNGYGGMAVDYLEPETAPPGREAWRLGGGEDAQVVYSGPRR
jgi:hypothetical protein